VNKKEAKKTLITAGFGAGGARARRSKSFLLLFFKKEALALPFLRKAWMPAFAGMTGVALFGP
jgi:hypothetical protein